MVSLPQCTVPEEGIVHTECHTEAYTNERSCGSGTLYITESHVRWINSEGNGFKLDYPSISIHAISRDTTTFPHECLYMILDVKLDADGDPADEGDESDSDSGGTEVRFVPAEKQNLDAMYQAMCACQELHPDPDQDDSDNDFYGEECLLGEGDGPQLSAQGLGNLARMEQMLASGGQGESTTNGHHEEEMEEDEGQYDDA